MRGNQDNTPIIMVTANSDEARERQCREAGANAFFGKPFEFYELLKCVEALLLPADRWVVMTGEIIHSLDHLLNCLNCIE